MGDFQILPGSGPAKAEHCHTAVLSHAVCVSRVLPPYRCHVCLVSAMCKSWKRCPSSPTGTPPAPLSSPTSLQGANRGTSCLATSLVLSASRATVTEVDCQVVSSWCKVDHGRVIGGSAVMWRVSVRRGWPVPREVMLALRRKRRHALPASACLTYSSQHLTQRSSLALVHCRLGCIEWPSDAHILV